MANRETSDAISSIAGKYMHFGQADLVALDEAGQAQLVTAIRALAASAMSQDEHKGKREPSAGTTAYEMVAATEARNVEVTETLIHMTAATVLSVLIDEEGGGRTNVTFSPADMDEMNRRYELDASHDGMITTVSIKPREGMFPKSMSVHTAPAAANAQVAPESLYREDGVDDTPADEQVTEHTYDRPLWAARVDGKLFPASDQAQAEKIVASNSAPDKIAQVENRFCYHNDCPAEHCNHGHGAGDDAKPELDDEFFEKAERVNGSADVPKQDGGAEVTSDS